MQDINDILWFFIDFISQIWLQIAILNLYHAIITNSQEHSIITLQHATDFISHNYDYNVIAIISRNYE